MTLKEHFCLTNAIEAFQRSIVGSRATVLCRLLVHRTGTPCRKM